MTFKLSFKNTNIPCCPQVKHLVDKNAFLCCALFHYECPALMRQFKFSGSRLNPGHLQMSYMRISSSAKTPRVEIIKADFC